MKIYSTNEWAPLQSVVVGSAMHANKPDGCHYDAIGAVPNDITSAADADLANFVNVLEQEGVTVHRPVKIDFVQRGGYYNYSPRDRLLVVGDTVVDCNMQYPCRDMEIEALDFVINSASRVLQVPRDQNIFFDAANVCRLNDTLLYLVSKSGNRAGAQWLTDNFPNMTVEATDTYSGVHIDSTFVPVREGLVVVNEDRVSKDTLPKCFSNWDVIWLGDADLKPKGYTGENVASNYIQLNFFMINPELAAIDDTPALKQALAQHGVQSYTIPLTHSRTLGGGHHCVTLDLHRE